MTAKGQRIGPQHRPPKIATTCRNGHDLRPAGAVYLTSDGKRRCNACHKQWWTTNKPAKMPIASTSPWSRPHTIERRGPDHTTEILALFRELEFAPRYEHEDIRARIHKLMHD